MALNTLLGQVTDEKLNKLPGRVRNPDRIQQHIEAFALFLQGSSYRGIQDHFGWKSLSTAQNSVRRGEILAKELDLDKERIRLKLAAYFDEIMDISMAQLRDQAEHGQVIQVMDDKGNKSITRKKGVDPRLLGEAGRGAIRTAQFAGLMDSDKATGSGAEVSTNVVFISPQADLSEWDTKTVEIGESGPASGPVLEVTPSETSRTGANPLLTKQIGATEAMETGENSTARVVQKELL